MRINEAITLAQQTSPKAPQTLWSPHSERYLDLTEGYGYSSMIHDRMVVGVEQQLSKVPSNSPPLKLPS